MPTILAVSQPEHLSVGISSHHVFYNRKDCPRSKAALKPLPTLDLYLSSCLQVICTKGDSREEWGHSENLQLRKWELTQSWPWGWRVRLQRGSEVASSGAIRAALFLTPELWHWSGAGWPGGPGEHSRSLITSNLSLQGN